MIKNGDSVISDRCFSELHVIYYSRILKDTLNEILTTINWKFSFTERTK